jgi:hypothetical protein
LLVEARKHGGAGQLGLDLDRLIEQARHVASNPPRDPGPFEAPASLVFPFRIELITSGS